MTEQKDGGPAFPNIHTDPEMRDHRGMTLRDYFAAAALTGALASGQVTHRNANDIPGIAYNYADAMLAERSKQ